MIKGKRFTVINTDAGIKGKVSAWAFWIRSEEVRHVKCGKFKVHIEKDTTKAEISAILNALMFVCKDEYLKAADVFVVNSDCQSAVSLLSNNKLEKYPELEEVFSKIKTILNKPICFKWVKGHSKGDSPRKWVNNYIDKLIRKHYK
jgi:ribonuclease HI